MSSNKTNHPELIGITGGIGSGKSVISQLLRTIGYPVYDSDSMAKKLMNESPVIKKKLTARFGTRTYAGGRLNRKYLADMMFTDKDSLEYVNRAVHPEVCKHFVEWARATKADKVFIESAILYSSGLDRVTDYAIYVDAPASIRLHRAMKRDKSTMEAIENRMHTQEAGESYARSHSRYVITNDDKTLVIPQILQIVGK